MNCIFLLYSYRFEIEQFDTLQHNGKDFGNGNVHEEISRLLR